MLQSPRVPFFKYNIFSERLEMKKILVVDDKSNVRTLVREYLTEQGFLVATAENGQMALYAARQEKPGPDPAGYHDARDGRFRIHPDLSQRMRNADHPPDGQDGRIR